MCGCVNIEVGSHINEVSIEIPNSDYGHTMIQYIRNRQKVGLSMDNTITMDACLKEEIIFLWNIGIKTGGCCCGHNVLNGMINVLDDSDIEKMKKLGYEVQYNPHAPNYEYTFYPKSIERIIEKS